MVKLITQLILTQGHHCENQNLGAVVGETSLQFMMRHFSFIVMLFNVSILVFQDPDADTSTADKLDNSISEWEDVSVDIEKWNVLIRQLEDVLALNCLLKLKIPPAKNAAVSATPSSDLLMVSVRHLLDGGRGT